MDFDLSVDQAALLESFDRVIANYSGLPSRSTDAYIVNKDLERALESNGFLDQSLARDLDPVAVIIAVEHAAASPMTLELANSIYIAPRVSKTDLPRPIAVADPGAKGPIRHLPNAATLLVEVDGSVRAVDLSKCEVEPIQGLFAYPLGRLVKGDLKSAPKVDADVATFNRLRRVAVAAEIVGVMQGALDLTVEYVKVRKQFKRPIGTFQTIRHRLAECAVVVAGSQRLAEYAAWSEDETDAELALAYAQESAGRLVYETQQFHGALGQTLEYPLHLWTYRLRALQGEFRGPSVNAAAAAEGIWGVEA